MIALGNFDVELAWRQAKSLLQQRSLGTFLPVNR
jgi:hypothetical protein